MTRKFQVMASLSCLIALFNLNDLTAQQMKIIASLPRDKSFVFLPRGPIKPAPNGIHNTYRSLDGTNNNIAPQRGEWGATEIALFRELPAEYGSIDTKNAIGGANRPSPRKISNALSDEPVTQFNARNLSAFVYVWGQFLDHDITLTPTGNTEYAPIPLPVDEPLFTAAIPFYRSEVFSSSGINNPRQQTNLNTAWIDGSVVYGSDETRAKWLRTFRDGKLKTSKDNFLPWNTLNGEYGEAIDPNAPSMADDANHTVKTFVAGDIRANEHPGITSLHILFVREHNRICDRYISQGLKNDEEIYQKARKEVGALIQAITYQEFLPALGVTLNTYSSYKDNVRPDIMNTFATAGYRIGHTMVADEIALRDNNCNKAGPGSLELLDVFFNPQLVVNYSPELFLKGFSTHKQYETDLKINSVLRNYLFGSPTNPVRFGLDLAAINIQRGRDHGLPNYNAVRALYLGNPIANFSQITSDAAKAATLQNLYGNVNNIDLWVGILAEDRLPGKSVGRTMHAMLKSQFEKLRDGDYYFYKYDPFLPQNLKTQMANTKLSDIIKRNTTLTNLQSNVFFIDPCPGETGEDDSMGSVSKNLNNSMIRERDKTSREFNLQIYPNPVNDRLLIELNTSSESVLLQLFSANGALIANIPVKTDDHLLEVKTSDYKSGLYLMRISDGIHVETVKFIIEHE